MRGELARRCGRIVERVSDDLGLALRHAIAAPQRDHDLFTVRAEQRLADAEVGIGGNLVQQSLGGSVPDTDVSIGGTRREAAAVGIEGHRIQPAALGVGVDQFAGRQVPDPCLAVVAGGRGRFPVRMHDDHPLQRRYFELVANPSRGEVPDNRFAGLIAVHPVAADGDQGRAALPEGQRRDPLGEPRQRADRFARCRLADHDLTLVVAGDEEPAVRREGEPED